MGRTGKMFEELRGRRAALIAYATGLYPDRVRSEEICRAMLESGADAIEIGLPFSDPVMDGPVIQEASATALRAGATPEGVLDLVRSLRESTGKPILVMTYYNPVFKYGLDRFAADAARAGVDGVIVPDLPAEEMGPLRYACSKTEIDTVAFCSQTTSDARIAKASRASSGFLYCVSLLGTTGARAELADGLPEFIARVRRHATTPLAVGLGVSTPEQCAEVGRLADGVIVGSAFVRAASADNGDLRELSALVRAMADALVR